MENFTFQTLIEELTYEPSTVVFIRDFGPALVDESSLTTEGITNSQVMFVHYFDDSKQKLITPDNYGRVLTKLSDLSPEVQFAIAMMEMTVARAGGSEIEFIPDEELN